MSSSTKGIMCWRLSANGIKAFEVVSGAVCSGMPFEKALVFGSTCSVCFSILFCMQRGSNTQPRCQLPVKASSEKADDGGGWLRSAAGGTQA